MHGDLELGGPVFWVIVVLMYAGGGFAAWVTFDALRARRAPAFSARPRSRLYWVVPQAVYLLLFLAVNVPGVAPPIVSGIFALATPFALALQVAYMLRVIYPSPERRAAQAMAESARDAGAADGTAASGVEGAD